MLRQLVPALLLVTILMISGSNVEAEFISFDASWQVTERGMDGEEENSSSYDQRYHLLWYPRVTHALSLDADMNYSRNWTTSNGTREIISPALNAELENDLFIVEFNGLATETINSENTDQSQYTWEAVVGSNWNYLYWPSLRMIVGQNMSSDSEDVHLTDHETEWNEFIAEWELDSLETYYSYYTQTRTDHVDSSVYDEQTHFGRIDYSRFFHESRGQFFISQQVTDTATDITADIGEGGSVNIAVGLSQALSAVDPTPERGTLQSNPGLINGNRNTAAFVVKTLERANLAVKADLQRVDRLYIYTGQLDPLHFDEATDLRWDLYTSRDGIDWQRERINPPTTYNRTEFRYEVDVSGTENIYLKLVVTNWPVTIPIPVTEIEAYSRRTGDGNRIDETETNTNYVTDLNIRYDPTASTRAIYSLVWDSSDLSPGNDRDRLFQSGSFSWHYNKYFVPTLTVNETTTDNSETTDTLYRSYGLSIRSTPLPTLDTTLGITRNESYEDDEINIRNHTINLLTSAVLYPNLESTLDLNVIFNDNEALDQSSRAYGIRWTLTGRLRSNLVADLITEYDVNTLDLVEVTNEEDSGGRTTIIVNYRPSDLVSFVLNASQGYGDKWSDYQYLFLDTSFSVLRTAKTLVRLGYQINASQDDTINSFNCNWNWTISPYLTLQSFANYMITEDENLWAINSRLTARF